MTTKYTVNRSEDGKTIWINSPHNCLGRFTMRGYEVYRDMGAPTEVIGTTNTLSVRVHDNKPIDWDNFKKLMKEHHKIDLDNQKSPFE